MCDSWNAVTYKKLVKSSKACEQWTEQQCQALDTLVQAKANTATPLCPEGAENIPLGSQVSDLCF